LKPRKTLQRRWDDFFRKHLYIRRENWDRYARVFRVVIEVGLKNLTHPLFGPWLRRLVRFEQEGKASSFIVPIHQDVAYLSEREGTVLPVEKIRRAIEESRYRIIMHRCICRDAFHCTNYPRDFACIMLGEACRHLVAHGIARSVTVAEALDHLDRATRLGLVGTCAWTEMESIAKGIPEAEKLDYFEICFCCPCCCSGLRNYRYWHRNETLRKHFSTMGWRAQGTAACTACGECLGACPVGAISLQPDGIRVGPDCLGCGRCAVRCPADAIVMKETRPGREHLLDYFRGIRPRI